MASERWHHSHRLSDSCGLASAHTEYDLCLLTDDEARAHLQQCGRLLFIGSMNRSGDMVRIAVAEGTRCAKSGVDLQFQRSADGWQSETGEGGLSGLFLSSSHHCSFVKIGCAKEAGADEERRTPGWPAADARRNSQSAKGPRGALRSARGQCRDGRRGARALVLGRRGRWRPRASRLTRRSR